MIKKVAIENKIFNFKNDLFDSKKYWIIYLIIILIVSLYQWDLIDYIEPTTEIITTILVSIIGILVITYYKGHNNDKELYKTAFLIIVSFGIITCLLTPICYTPDEVEHFVRSEMTSNGIIIPEYDNGTFLTIQSTIDLIENSRNTWDTGFDGIDLYNASILKTDADTKPINYSLVEYPSAFAQNPFYGYLPQAIGMVIAKLLNLNAIWLLWLGRIFNIITYAILVSFAVKKSPILKVPLIIFSCIPLSIFITASVSIDGIIGGLSLLVISYFFYLYKSPHNTLNKNHILKFSLLVILLGLCKVTCFAFIILLFGIPRDNFKDGNYRIKSIISIVSLGIIAVLWTKFYADPGFFESFRAQHNIINHVNSTQQITYISNHITDTIITILHSPWYITDWNFIDSKLFNMFYLMFLGSIFLLYPKEKIDLKSKLIAFITCGIIYVGTFITFLLSWTPVGQLNQIIGIQTRYFLPFFALIPFIFSINYQELNRKEIDIYLMIILMCFLAFQNIWFACNVY